MTHQVSDWVAHYKDVRRATRPGEEVVFNGYANSHQVLSPYFHHDILRAKREAEHALTEFFHDAHVTLTDTSDMFAPGRVKVELPKALKRAYLHNVLLANELRNHIGHRR